MKDFFKSFFKDIMSNVVATIVIFIFVFFVYQVGKLILKSYMTEQLANIIAALIFVVIIAVCFVAYLLKRRSDKRKKEEYYNTTATKEFKQFTIDVMQRYYGEKYLTKINGDTIITEYCLPASKRIMYDTSIKDFDMLCDKEGSNILDFKIKDHKKYKSVKFYDKYSCINKHEIQRPYHPGFMLEKASINNDGLVDKINNISVHLGIFAENVYTSDILEYELYEAYLHFEKEWKKIKEKNIKDEFFWERIKKSLEIRNHITEKNGNAYNSLFNGNGRQSLITVQMIVVFKDHLNKGEYRVQMIQRSDDVAQAPGEYQMVPCGGFDLLHESYNPYVIEENLSPGSCVFREYLEEVIEGKDVKAKYEGRGEGAVAEIILKNSNVLDICKMLDNKNASLQFLGSAVSLVLLRHTLFFALVIHDESFSCKPFIGNHEVKGGDILSMPINQVDDPEQDCWKMMNAGSKALWYMFKQTKEYEEIVKSDSQKDNN